MIRPATAEDVPAIARINRVSRSHAMPWLPVLHSPQAVVGFCGIAGGWLNHLYIHPDHQRLGLGAAFIAWAKEDAQDLHLWVFEQNQAARDFYAKHGFIEQEPTGGRTNKEGCPDIRMRWAKSMQGG